MNRTWNRMLLPPGKDRRVALLSLEGVLTEGKVLGVSPSLTELLREVVEKDIKALVVRINSPGGTVSASQEIYTALRQLSEEKGVKVVASMGDVAASGGVYTAMAADYIFAQPGTVTGSIGVIIRSGNVRGLLEKVGVSSEVVKSGPYKDILSPERPMTEAERALLQETIDDTYGQFVSLVAARRNQPEAQVKAYADGRIFSGQQALKLGLVDGVGGLEAAITKARELAGLSMKGFPRIEKLEKKKSWVQKLLQSGFRGSAMTGASGFGFLGLLEQELQLQGMPLWLMPTWGRGA